MNSQSDGCKKKYLGALVFMLWSDPFSPKCQNCKKSNNFKFCIFWTISLQFFIAVAYFFCKLENQLYMSTFYSLSCLKCCMFLSHPGQNSLSFDFVKKVFFPSYTPIILYILIQKWCNQVCVLEIHKLTFSVIIVIRKCQNLSK